MAIIGDLADLGVPDLLYMFKMRTMSGRLTVEMDGERADLVLEHGSLVRVSSNRVSQRVGDLLVQLGHLELSDIEALVAEQARAGGTNPLGALLVERKLVTPADLEAILLCQAEEILLRLLTWTEGAFEYWPGPPPASAVPLPEINVERLILEAFRQADDWEAVRQRVPSLDVALSIVPGAAARADASIREMIVLASLRRGAVTPRDVARVTRLSEVEVVRLVDALASRGVIGVRPVRLTGPLAMSALAGAQVGD
jgi:hypothetical protein